MTSLVTLNNGQTFEAQTTTVSKDRYFDGRDWPYFETTAVEEPRTLEADHYHDWQLENGETLTAWLVPMAVVVGVQESAE